jgi:hypothetical protein
LAGPPLEFSTALDVGMASDLVGATGDMAGRVFLWRFPHRYPWTEKVVTPPAMSPTAPSAPQEAGKGASER